VLAEDGERNIRAGCIVLGDVDFDDALVSVGEAERRAWATVNKETPAVSCGDAATLL
jgi:hypothetical protein